MKMMDTETMLKISEFADFQALTETLAKRWLDLVQNLLK